MNPAHPFPYSNLAYAYRGAGRFAEAKRTAERAVSTRHRNSPDAAAALSAGGARQAMPRPPSGISTGRNRVRAGSTSRAPRRRSPRIRGRMADARRLFQQTIDEAGRSQLAQIAQRLRRPGGTHRCAVWRRSGSGSARTPDTDGRHLRAAAARRNRPRRHRRRGGRGEMGRAPEAAAAIRHAASRRVPPGCRGRCRSRVAIGRTRRSRRCGPRPTANAARWQRCCRSTSGAKPTAAPDP